MLDAACNACAGLFAQKNRFSIQKSHAAQFAARFYTFGIGDRTAKHLIPTADSNHRAAGCSVLQDRRLKSRLPQPTEIVHRILRAGQDHNIG